MSDKFFNTVRFLSEVLITAIGALWFSLSEIWGASVFPYGKEVVATCAALSTFLGIFTAWQRTKYNSKKGEDDE